VAKRRASASWDAGRVKALREHMRLTQAELARELGTRQQTISEWETGMYQPRGLSERLLSLVAERADFDYSVDIKAGETPDPPEEGPAGAGAEQHADV
jgi:transcriptional regulator with XRE-family HTH domain